MLFVNNEYALGRPHASEDFCIRKFFYADTKISASTRSVYESYTTIHTYPHISKDQSTEHAHYKES